MRGKERKAMQQVGGEEDHLFILLRYFRVNYPDSVTLMFDFIVLDFTEFPSHRLLEPLRRLRDTPDEISLRNGRHANRMVVMNFAPRPGEAKREAAERVAEAWVDGRIARIRLAQFAAAWSREKLPPGAAGGPGGANLPRLQTYQGMLESFCYKVTRPMAEQDWLWVEWISSRGEESTQNFVLPRSRSEWKNMRLIAATMGPEC